MAVAQELPASPNLATAKKSLPWGWIAVLLAVGAIALFYGQVAYGNVLITPWYLPIAGTLASLLMVRAAVSHRSLLRGAVAAVLMLLAAAEWYFLLAMTLLPGYTGPVAAGSPLPAFHAQRADGSPIDASYFRAAQPKLLVFYQGHWCPFCMAYLRQLEAHHADFGSQNTEVVVVSLDDLAAAKRTQQEFPHLTVVSDADRELATSIDVINKGFSPAGDDSAPTLLLVDGTGTVQWLNRPTRFIARPSVAEIVTEIEARVTKQGR